MTIGMNINNIIDINDIIYIQLPIIINLNKLKKITINNAQITQFNINNNIISLNGVQITTSIQTLMIL